MTAASTTKKVPSGVANPRDTTRYRCGLRAAGEALLGPFFVIDSIRQNRSVLP